MEKTVIVGMSGGVDSAAAAFILKEKGFQVQGIFLDLYEKKDVRAKTVTIQFGKNILMT